MTAGTGESNDIRTLPDPVAEAVRIVGLADEHGLLVRIMGGLAFHVQAPTWTARLGIANKDIDIATQGRDRKVLAELLEAEGYTPDRRHNTLFGHKQLYFVDEPRRRPVDVLVDQFEMCHRFDLAGRLAVEHPTLPLAELLMSKLQVVKINRKDVLDALILLGEHPLAPGDGIGESAEPTAAISTDRITALTSNDWGWWRTTTGNLTKLVDFVAADLEDGELDVGRPLRFDLSKQIADLRAAIDTAPKSTGWKLRSRIGDRVAWYALPEEEAHGQYDM